MNLRTLAIAAGIAASAVLTATFVLDAEAGTKEWKRSFDDTTVRWEHFTAYRLTDGGVRLSPFCISVKKPDGGVLVLEQPCVTCEGALGPPLLAGCLNAVKAANELP